MKVRDDQMCSYCNDVVDYIQNFLLAVRRLGIFGITLNNNYILIIFEIQTHLTVVDVLF